MYFLFLSIRNFLLPTNLYLIPQNSILLTTQILTLDIYIKGTSQFFFVVRKRLILFLFISIVFGACFCCSIFRCGYFLHSGIVALSIGYLVLVLLRNEKKKLQKRKSKFTFKTMIVVDNKIHTNFELLFLFALKCS